jgi:hypothetical protein
MKTAQLRGSFVLSVLVGPDGGNQPGLEKLGKVHGRIARLRN